ncbi:MAG: hypothetical protein ACREHC_02670 [Candidatus Levyibacteriota bacterium]
MVEERCQAKVGYEPVINNNIPSMQGSIDCSNCAIKVTAIGNKREILNTFAILKLRQCKKLFPSSE